MPRFRALRRSELWMLAAVVVAMLGITAWIRLAPQPSILQLMAIEPPAVDRMSLIDAPAWSPSGQADAHGFYTVIDQERFALRLHPESTQIALVDKDNGRIWYSNPREEQLEGETVKGLLLSNLKSPFIMEYYQDADNKNNRREMANATAANLGKAIAVDGNRLQITYAYAKEQIRFTLLYELTGTGLKLSVPSAGIVEEAEYQILALSLLPYFGAAQAGTEGYFLVPDGPGGLIRFLPERDIIGQGYSGSIYGEEMTNALNTGNSEVVQYPAYGVNQDGSGFLATIGSGQFESRIRAYAPGSQSNWYSVYPQITYREEYLRKVSRIAPPVKAIYPKRVEADFTIEYRMLDNGAADYISMAVAYQEQLLDAGMLDAPLPAVDHVPLYLTLIMGDAKRAFNRDLYTPATTFEQAGQIASGLTALGVQNQRITLRGWQQGGTMDRTDRFPLEASLGGTSGAKAFIARMHELGHKVIFADDYVWVDSRSSMRPRGNGVRGIEEIIYFNSDKDFIMKPLQTLSEAYRSIKEFASYGADGVHFDEVGSFVFRDFEPAHPQSRQEAAYYQQQLLAYAQDALGDASVETGFDYALGAASHIVDMPLWSRGNFIVDETVPFYPIALHGYIPYTSAPGNLRDLPTDEWLRALEYGALPAYTLTYESAQKLRGTAQDGVYTSQYANWKDEVAAEYEAFQQLAGIYNQRIIGHAAIAPKVFRTTYADGTQVIVDYNQGSFKVEHGGGGSHG